MGAELESSSQRNGRGPPPARAQMIEYLISRTMGNQRRHTASLLAVQSLSVRSAGARLFVLATRFVPIQGRLDLFPSHCAWIQQPRLFDATLRTINIIGRSWCGSNGSIWKRMKLEVLMRFVSSIRSGT